MIREILFVLFLLTTVSLYSQKQQYIGIGINSEIHSGDNMRIGCGVSYENQLSKHHGFELGVMYRSKLFRYYQTLPSTMIDNQSTDIREDYLSLPIMYKFYSNILNVSTGVSFDYFVGWDDLTKSSNIELTSYSVDPKLYIGWVFKVGKTIKLSPKFILEPEIQFNPIFDYGYSYYGVSVKLKYKLEK
jgi:hypothetical protein